MQNYTLTVPIGTNVNFRFAPSFHRPAPRDPHSATTVVSHSVDRKAVDNDSKETGDTTRGSIVRGIIGMDQDVWFFCWFFP